MLKKWNKKKSLLFIGVLLLASVVSTALVIAVRGKKETEPVPPQFYFAKSEKVPSVTDVVGDRTFEAIPEEEEETSSGEALSVEKYRYFSSDTSDADVRSYMDYLMENKNFLDITEAEDESEADEKKGKTFRLTGPSEDEESYLEITITVENGSYTVSAVKEGKSWNSYIASLWEAEKNDRERVKQPEQGGTRQIAEEKVRSMSQKELKLPEPVSRYEFIAGPGLVYVDGKNFYRVSAYRKQENGTLTYECAYLMDYSSQNVCYKYNDVTEETEPLR